LYLKPLSAESTDEIKISPVFYTIVAPMLHPLIYSLRKKVVKVALRKTPSRRKFWSETESLCACSDSAVRFHLFI
jgi:hypothetical protein